MSVNSAMTAIADKIRALLGIGGSMGLEAMAQNLTTVQGDITSAYSAVRGKNGAVPVSQVSGNLAAAIDSIPSSIPLQRKTGTFTTNDDGTATVNCGFRPDLVVIHKNESIDGYCQTAAFAFAEDTRSTTLNSAMWNGDESTEDTWIYDLVVTQTSSGFSVEMYAYDEAWEDTTPITTFTYTAVKYT